MKYRWQLCSEGDSSAKVRAEEWGVSPLLAHCMMNRGVDSPSRARAFLSPRLSDLSDPFLLPDMQKAVVRLFRARDEGETLTAFGDYDVDGLSSVALLALAMRELGWKLNCYIPHRIDEGYGLSRDAIENCLRQHPTRLVLAVDCGSTSAAVVGELSEKGVDVIVLDHHQIGSPVPQALALVNPQAGPQNGEADSRALCSAGLAFKLLHALVKEGRQRGCPQMASFDVRPYLDLVALGTVADLVPLTGENRILAAAGLECLSRSERAGLVALKQKARVGPIVKAQDVSFLLAPRLNAAGRLESASASLEMLMCETALEASALVEQLEGSNRSRQEMEREIAAQVFQRIRARGSERMDRVIVEGDPAWHIGVVGIVAARVMREFNRPTIICGGDGASLRGSGRSVEGFDLVATLHGCADLLSSHGGHAMAAGVSLLPENLDALRSRLDESAREALPGVPLAPALRLDASSNLFDMTLRQMEDLERLQPIGQGNPPVQLLFPGLRLHRAIQRMGREGQHAKLVVTDGVCTAEAIMWQVADADLPHDEFDLAAAPQINEYHGRRSVQLKVLDWRRAGGE